MFLRVLEWHTFGGSFSKSDYTEKHEKRLNLSLLFLYIVAGD